MDNTENNAVTKKCSKCGRTLPADKFHKNSKSKDGLYSYCKDCTKERDSLRGKKRRQESIKDFTARELMEELARRGYTGKLEYVEIHTIDITNF